MSAVQLVDLADPAHADAVAGVVIEVAQPVVEVLRAEIERAVQELAVAFHEFPVALAGRAVVDALHQRQLVDHAPPHHATTDQKLETRSEEHTSELKTLMSISLAAHCLK